MPNTFRGWADSTKPCGIGLPQKPDRLRTGLTCTEGTIFITAYEEAIVLKKPKNLCMDGLVNFQGAVSLANRRRTKRGSTAWPRATSIILRGANPGELPVSHPGRYYLTINKSAAQAIGLALPLALVAKADRLFQ